MFYGFNYKKFFELKTKKVSIIPQAIDHILKGKEDLKKRFIKETTALLEHSLYQYQNKEQWI